MVIAEFASAAALAVGAASLVTTTPKVSQSDTKICEGMVDLLSKPPALWASSTAWVSNASALSGTMERNPIRGGSKEGCVRFP